jgi:hypothetical protein
MKYVVPLCALFVLSGCSPGGKDDKAYKLYYKVEDFQKEHFGGTHT